MHTHTKKVVVTWFDGDEKVYDGDYFAVQTETHATILCQEAQVAVVVGFRSIEIIEV